MSKSLYMSYYREDKTTHKREYIRTNLFKDPIVEWVATKDKADKYSSYDSFLNNVKAHNIVFDEEKYDYDFEEVA